MEKEKKEEKRNIGISEEPGDETLEMRPVEVPDEKEEQQVSKTTSSAEDLGRMIAAGLIAAVILSGIAVLVAGIFQITSRWLIPCVTDLPVNDPAPILWSEMISDKTTAKSLGVPEKLASGVRFKGAVLTAGAK
jgi:hypothetical protein